MDCMPRLPSTAERVSSTSSCGVQAAESVGLTFDDLHVPLLVRAAYGDWPLKLIVMLRDPLDRFYRLLTPG